MKRVLFVLGVLGFTATISAAGQVPPVRLGAHVGGNMMNGLFDLYRVGGQMVIPFSPRLSVYPSVSRFLDGEAEWEVSAALRIRPFGDTYGTSSFYMGIGAAFINFGTHTTTYDQWITGLELPYGRVRPYVELQFLGVVTGLLLDDGDWGLQLHSGVTWAVR